MSLEASLRESGAALCSDRVTERRKSAEALKTYLSGSAAPALLSSNSSRRAGYCWDQLFDDVHEHILKELENFETSKTFESSSKPLATSLLHMVVTGSRKGKAYIKCDKITSACLFILKNKKMTKAIGDAYLNLLYKYIVGCEYYSGFITPQTFEDLLDVSLHACGSNYSKLDYYTKLRLVWLIMETASRRCQFVLPLRDALPSIQKLFLTPTSDKKVQGVVMDICLLLIQNLSSESRLAMCAFVEAILGTLTQFYDTSYVKTKLTLFKVLRGILALHHPQGRSQHQEGSKAFNWSNWNRSMDSVTEIVLIEIKHLQKFSDAKFRMKDDENKYWTAFYQLAASVFHQIFNVPDKENEAIDGNTSKRQKVSLNKHKMFIDLLDEFRQSHTPWLGILKFYVQEHGSSISTGEYTSLLTLVDNYVSSNNTNISWGDLDEVTCAVLRDLRTRSSAESDLPGVLQGLCSSCVRHSTLSGNTHKATHNIIKELLNFEQVDFQIVQTLTKLYHEKAMPVTEHSVSTYSRVYDAYFSKYNNCNDKAKTVVWLLQNDSGSTEASNIPNMLYKLIKNENVDVSNTSSAIDDSDNLYKIIFDSIDKCILLSELVINYKDNKACEKPSEVTTEFDAETETHIRNALTWKLTEHTDKFKNNDIKFAEYIKYVKIVLDYCNSLLKHMTDLLASSLYKNLKISLRLIFASLNVVIADESNDEVEVIGQVVKILAADYTALLSTETRSHINKDVFHNIHKRLNTLGANDEDESMAVDESSVPSDVRRSFIMFLAAYCRQPSSWQEDVQELILDAKFYNFNSLADIESALDTLDMLIAVDSPSVEPIFRFMQSMCKELFRNARATEGLLKILLKLLHSVWSHPSQMLRNNCSIMIKGYLQRCGQLYYPPRVAALIYECVARIAELNHKLDYRSDVDYRASLLEGIKSDVHSIRLYCCYLFRNLSAQFGAGDIQGHTFAALELFTIKVSDTNEQVMRDELSNRSHTVLHSFLALSANAGLVPGIITSVLKVHKEKRLHSDVVKKILDQITQTTSVDLELYVERNILNILYFWFTSKYKLEEIPVDVFGYSCLDEFVQKHVEWLVPAEVLWSRNGEVDTSAALEMMRKRNTPVTRVLETCLTNINALCLPYIASEMYALSFGRCVKQSVLSELSRAANRMFHRTKEIIGDGRWSELFAERMGRLVRLAATLIADDEEVQQMFGVRVARRSETYFYNWEVYCGILKYLNVLIDEDVMRHLCENVPLAVSRTAVKLWENFLHSTCLQQKALSLHAFVKFVQSVPLGLGPDAFVCNFACRGLLHVINLTKDEEELKVYVEALKSLLERFLPDKREVMKETLLLAVSILNIKKEEGCEACAGALAELAGADDVDAAALSQQVAAAARCLTKTEFTETVKGFMCSLNTPSFEVLCKLKKFLVVNKNYVLEMRSSLDIKGFSEECKTSLLHQITNTLTGILTSANDEKTIVEASDCLSQIGTYDLRTLVMAAPSESSSVSALHPAQYLAIATLSSLSRLLYDPRPGVVSQVMASLARLMVFKEGRVAYDLEVASQPVLKQFLAPGGDCPPAQFTVDGARFQAYRAADAWAARGEGAAAWLLRVTTALVGVFGGTHYLGSLIAVCQDKTAVCEAILPGLVGLLLSIADEEQTSAISAQLTHFFERVSQDASQDAGGGPERGARVVAQHVLAVVDFVRLQMTHYAKRPGAAESLNHLRLPYQLVARAAAAAGRPLAAVYYGELWAAHAAGAAPPRSPAHAARLPGGPALQRVFRECFTAIGELDAIDGCGSEHLTSEVERRKHLAYTGRLPDALLAHDIALSAPTGRPDHPTGGSDDPTGGPDHPTDRAALQRGVVDLLYQSGMHHLALEYIRAAPENAKLDDVKYECLSFLGDWSVYVDARDVDKKLGDPSADMLSLLKEIRYACLKECLTAPAPADGLAGKLTAPLTRGKLAVSKLCRKMNMDNCQSVYTAVSHLQMLTDIEDYFSVRSGRMRVERLLASWQVERLSPFHEFRHVESLVAQRSVLLEHAARTHRELVGDVVKLQLRYAELGLANGRDQLSQRLLAVAKTSLDCGEVTLLEAQIAWAQSHKEIALSLLRNMLRNKELDDELTATALRQYGHWMWESKRESAREVIGRYLQRGAGLCAGAARLRALADIARCADAEYKQVLAYTRSSVFEHKVKCMTHMKGAASELRSTQQSLSREEQRAMVTNERLSSLDEAEIENTIAEKKRFLELAMKYYLLSLTQGEEDNLSVFRVTSLWLDNPTLSLPPPDPADGPAAGPAGPAPGPTGLAPGAAGGLPALLAAVPARKFVPVLPQLAPRLGEGAPEFVDTLEALLKRCAIEHPHHTLPILFALKNSEKDRVILTAPGRREVPRGRGGGARGSDGGARGPDGGARVAAAGALLRTLAGCASLEDIIAEMDKMCDALISFANFKSPAKGSRQAVPRAEPLARLRALPHVPVPVLTLPVRADCRYEEFPAVESFADTFDLVGGINCPKKMTCRGSDGQPRTLLIKGEDDLRQDAVMQQVFTIVNTLLQLSPATGKNRLLIRTYKVVPLSRRSGVLEWCAGTVPLGLYLAGGGAEPGAHRRHRPQDISCSAARAIMNAAHQRGQTAADKLSALRRVLRDFRPAMQHFFTDHYPDPGAWYERRLAYTKSVATSSMVGYILGLGDRHVQNILIDRRSAEVVHIDFGIAFDQGKALPTPETVPFRLTQDVVAGFGCAGVEGIFRKSCERTLQLLRDNQSALLTILEVLLCDPLCSWAVTPAQAHRKQNIAANDASLNTSVQLAGSGLAERALLAVSSKLSGAECGGGASVAGQVARLVSAARDPENLCRLYPGWQPYL